MQHPWMSTLFCVYFFALFSPSHAILTRHNSYALLYTKTLAFNSESNSNWFAQFSLNLLCFMWIEDAVNVVAVVQHRWKQLLLFFGKLTLIHDASKYRCKSDWLYKQISKRKVYEQKKTNRINKTKKLKKKIL